MKNLDKFIKEVAYAEQKVPFYRKKLNAMGVTASDINVSEDLAKLPYTAKVDYRKNFPKGVMAEGFLPNHPMLSSSRSSGSTGERLITIELGMYLLNRAMSCSEINPAIYKAFSTVGRIHRAAS